MTATVPSVSRAHSRLEDCPTLELHDVRAGDLFFGCRPSPLQVLCAISGDQWRHVGLILAMDGDLYVVEGGPQGLQRRRLDVAARAYTQIGIARLRSDLVPAAIDAGEWAAHEEQGAYSFPWNVAARVGWCSFARRRLSMSSTGLARSPFQNYASQLDQNEDVATCSYLVVRALAASGLDALAAPNDDASGNLPTSMASMVTPEDIWRLPVVASRYAVEPLVDHADEGSLGSLKRILSRKKNRSSHVTA